MDLDSTTTTPTRARAARRPREERERLLAAFASGGLPEAAFVREHGIKLRTFRKWRYEGGSKRPRPTPRPAMAPVRIIGEAGAGSVVIRLASGTEVSVPMQAGLPAVAVLVRQLEGRC